MRSARSPRYFLYILRCADGSLYTGITTDVERRFREHQKGKGGHYTRSRTVLSVVHTEELPNRSAALRREYEIKRWSRAKKLQLVRAQRAV